MSLVYPVARIVDSDRVSISQESRKRGGGTFRDVDIFFSRFKVLVSSIDSKKRGVSVSGALQQRL